MKSMSVLFKSMHSIDIDAKEIREKQQIPQEFEGFISELIDFITTNNNVKNYKVHDDFTQTVGCIRRITAYAKQLGMVGLNFDEITESIQDQAESIADKLLREEVKAQQKIEPTGQSVKRGSLIQALLSDDEDFVFVLAKVEHSEWYDGESLLKNFGFPNDKKNVWKSAVFQMRLAEDDITIDRIQVYTDNAAKYWADSFLEVDEERSDSMNTRVVFSSLDQTLERCVRKTSESDYTILRNTLIGKMKKPRQINYDDFVDELVCDYQLENPILNMREVRTKLIELGNKNKFDKQFQTEPSELVVTRRRYKYKPVPGVEISIIGAVENLKRDICSREDDKKGRYLEIRCTDDKTFEAFKFNACLHIMSD